MEAERGRHHGEGGCAMDIMLVVEEVRGRTLMTYLDAVIHRPCKCATRSNVHACAPV